MILYGISVFIHSAMEDGDWRRKMTQYLLGLVVYTFTECAGCIPSCHFCLLKTRSILSGLLLVDITILKVD